MELFRGVMRINASDKSQAYVTLKSLSADIFVRVSPANLLTIHMQMLEIDIPFKTCPAWEVVQVTCMDSSFVQTVVTYTAVS